MEDNYVYLENSQVEEKKRKESGSIMKSYREYGTT